MRIAVPRETTPGELRVAVTPDVVARLVKAGHELRIEAGAGARAGFPDSTYVTAGATVSPLNDLYADATLVCKVQPPSRDEAASMPRETSLLSLLNPARNADLLTQLAERGITALALELVPRITRAQSMDVLSSQSTVAGYKAVLIGASALPKFLPMLTTAAGTVSPAKVFIIGAGVAGLQAIATARRLGGVVSAFDVRPAAREQVQSLGASFVASELVTQGAETSGGYAKEQSRDDAQRTRDALTAHLKEMDLVVTTAQIPGRDAPRLITADMVAGMKPRQRHRRSRRRIRRQLRAHPRRRNRAGRHGLHRRPYQHRRQRALSRQPDVRQERPCTRHPFVEGRRPRRGRQRRDHRPHDRRARRRRRHHLPATMIAP